MTVVVLGDIDVACVYVSGEAWVYTSRISIHRGKMACQCHFGSSDLRSIPRFFFGIELRRLSPLWAGGKKGGHGGLRESRAAP